MKVVSLFSGAGGLDLGFKMAGHDIIWANDLYGDAVETYRLNLGDHIVCEDIFKVDEKDSLSQTQKDMKAMREMLCTSSSLE